MQTRRAQILHLRPVHRKSVVFCSGQMSPTGGCLKGRAPKKDVIAQVGPNASYETIANTYFEACGIMWFWFRSGGPKAA
jgi:hypothetical protein